MGILFEHRLKVAGTDTRALELDGDGPPLLLLHGWGDSADTWRPLMDRLRRDGRRALALDLPGFGTASSLDHVEPVLAQLDRFVRSVLIQFGDGEDWFISGNSLGGCITLRAAEHEELPIAGVMPIAPAGLDLARWLSIMSREPLVRMILNSPTPVPKPIIRNIVAQIYRRAAFSDNAQINQRVIRSFTSHIETRRDAIRVLAAGRRMQPELATALELERVQCPVLVVWGDKDRMLPISGADRVMAQIPGARLEVLKGCGHCPQVERVDEVADLLEAFVAAPEAVGSAPASKIA